MKCTNCKKNDANTHVKKVVNGVREEMHLCEECAQKLGIIDEINASAFDVNSIFDDFFNDSASAINQLIGIDRCPNCGISINEIINIGKVGCSECYNKFYDRLLPSIGKMQTGTKHLGKVISYSEDEEKTNQYSIKDAKKALKIAIKEQRFEDAAVLRDQIKEMEKES